MQRYQDYATLMLGGPKAENLVPAPELLTPQQRAGVPDIQLEVFSDVREQFDCMSLASLPFNLNSPHIEACDEFKQKYLLFVAPLLRAGDSAKRRTQFHTLVVSILGPNFSGTITNMKKLVTTLLDMTPQAIQEAMGMNAGAAPFGKSVLSVARYINEHIPFGQLMPPPQDGIQALIAPIFGMGMKTACLFYRWMTEPSPDLGYWETARRTYIPVDSRIMQTSINAKASLGDLYPYLRDYPLPLEAPKPTPDSLFPVVTNFVRIGLGFGNDYLRADYPFWALARPSAAHSPPICYNRISALGSDCPLLRNGRSPDPRCYHCNCPFTG